MCRFLTAGASLVKILLHPLGLEALHPQPSERLFVLYKRTTLGLHEYCFHFRLPAQWLPHALQAQWVYLLYRTVVSFYFLVWLITSNINLSSPKILIYLTEWSFIFLNAYLLVALITTAINFILVYVHPKRKEVLENSEMEESERSKSCGCHGDHTTICDKIAWLLFLIGTESAVAVVILYWALISGDIDSEEQDSAINIHFHLLNGIVAVLELWITGLPVHLLHFIYPTLFAAVYSAFTGAYYAVNGTGSDGERYIYPVLDYSSQPGVAAGIILGAVVGLSVIHVLFFLQYLLRHWLTSLLQHKVELYQRYFKDLDESGPIDMFDVLM